MSLETFSKRIKELMREENISVNALSEELKIERKSIFLWRSGRYYPKYDALIKLIYHFEVSAEYLLGLSDQPRQVLKREKRIDFEQKFKLRLVKFMDENECTMYKMAKDLGIGQTVFKRWVAKGAIPEVSNLIKLSVLTGETIEYFLGIED